MLRIACILLSDHAIRICAPIHDALLIEAPLDELDDVITKAESLMRKASGIVLDGFELNSDVKVKIGRAPRLNSSHIPLSRMPSSA